MKSRVPISPQHRRGMILIVVTIVLVMISLAGYGFVAVMYTENKAAHLNVDEIHVHNAAASGVELLKGMMAQRPDRRVELGGLYDNPDLFQGAVVFDEPGTPAVVRCTLLSPRIEEGQITGIRYGAQNESTRINLAVLADWDKAVPDSGRQALMKLPGMTESVADAILDWLDADNSQRSSGAEVDYYGGLEPPYEPRNGPVESLEELLLVKGVTRELLFGGDRDRNYQLDDNGGDGTPLGPVSDGLPWAEYLTIFSGERNVRPNGAPRIYLNHPDLRELHQALTGQLTESWVRFIIAYRQHGPYSGSDPGEANATINLDLNTPPKFNIGSILDLVGGRVSVPGSSGSPQVYQSPLLDTPDAMRTDLPSLMDVATVDKSLVLRGRININSAPREVVAAIPGMSDSTAEQILAARGLRDGDEDPNRRHPVWLLTEGLVDRETMRALLPYITCGGDVYRAQVVGYFDQGTPSARAEVVISATEGFPRQVYYKDLRLFGRGFALETLRGEAAADDTGSTAAESLITD